MARGPGGATPPFTVRTRRLWRTFRSGPAVVQVVVLVIIGTLVADLAAVGARTGRHGTSTVSTAAGDRRRAEGNTPGLGTEGGPGDTTGAAGASGASGANGGSGGGTGSGT